MKKKIFDILPPARSEEKNILLFEEKIKSPEFSVKERKWKMWWGIIPLILFLAVAFSFRLSKTEIKIWPQVQTVSFETKITVDKTFESSDPSFWVSKKTIPGKIFEVEKVFSEEFSSSGKSFKKAEGVIRVYNGYSPSPEKWLEGTRFVSAEGKLFKSKDKISVPGAEVKNGKMSPSFVDVPVVAGEPGQDYNIGPSNFSIIAFRGTPRYTKFYGESFQSMTGGGEEPQVKKEDLENAGKALVQKAEKEVKDELKNEIPGNFFFSEALIKTEILEKFPLVKEGANLAQFGFQVKSKAKLVSAAKEDIDSLAREFISSQISKEKRIYQPSLKTEYAVQSIDVSAEKFNLSLSMSAKIYPEIDLDSLKKAILGKSLSETKIFLKNQSEIIKSDIRLFPFWLKNIVNDFNKVKIEYPLVD